MLGLTKLEKRPRLLMNGLSACCLHKAEKVVSHPDSWDNLPRLRLHLFIADPLTYFDSHEQASTQGDIHFW